MDSEARSASGIEGETMGAGSENLKRRPVSRVADDADSFELDPKARLYLCLAAVAKGTVISYGALAAQAGVPRGARWALSLIHI